MTLYFEERAPIVASELANELDTELQVAIASAGWSNNAHIEASKGVLNLTYIEEHEGNLFESEYGKEGQSPNSVIRPFLANSEETVKRAMQDEALNFLFLQGILP